MLTFAACSKDPSCSDGEQNQGETGIDCGGPCTACTINSTATCSDGVQNQDETGIDCGGANCSPCGTTASCTDGIQNQGETGVDCGGPCSPCATNTGSCTATIGSTAFTANSTTGQLSAGILVLTFTDGSQTIQLTYSGNLQAGTVTLGGTNTINIASSSVQAVCNTGQVQFTTFNTTTKVVSGTFEATCLSVQGGNVALTGTFSNVTYQ